MSEVPALYGQYDDEGNPLWMDGAVRQLFALRAALEKAQREGCGGIIEPCNALKYWRSKAEAAIAERGSAHAELEKAKEEQAQIDAALETWFYPGEFDSRVKAVQETARVWEGIVAALDIGDSDADVVKTIQDMVEYAAVINAANAQLTAERDAAEAMRDDLHECRETVRLAFASGPAEAMRAKTIAECRAIAQAQKKHWSAFSHQFNGGWMAAATEIDYAIGALKYAGTRFAAEAIAALKGKGEGK